MADKAGGETIHFKVAEVVLLEDREGQTRLGDRVPRPVEQVLELCGPEAAEEDLAHELAEEDDHDEGLDVDDGHARVALGDVDDTRVELLPLVICVADDRRGHGEARAGQQSRPHAGGHARPGVGSQLDYNAG